MPLKNTIELSSDNYKSTINHELFHVSTTYIDSNSNVIYCGFSQLQIKKGNKQIGEGLNEGYTQYLTDKYFPSKPLLMAYSYEKRIAEIVELIVGQEKMQSLYFNANLKGLIDVLKQYSTEENAYNFIVTLDFLNKHLTDKKLTTNSNEIKLDSLKIINSFLIQLYINKIILEQPNKKIDTKEIIDKLISLLTLLPGGATTYGKSFNVTDNELIMKIINDAFSSYEISEDKTILKQI